MKRIKAYLTCALTYNAEVSASEQIAQEEKCWKENVTDYLSGFELFSDYSIDVSRDHFLHKSNAHEYHLTPEIIARDYDSYDGFIVICDTDLLSYISAVLSFSLCNFGKTVVVISPAINVDGRLLGGIDADQELRDEFKSDIGAAVKLATMTKLEWQGVYFVRQQGIYSATHVKYWNANTYEVKGHLLGEWQQQMLVDIDGLNCYKARYQPFAVDSADLIVKSKLEIDVSVNVVHHFHRPWDLFLKIAKDSKCKVMCFTVEHFSAIGDLDSPENQEGREFFSYCKNSKIPVVVVKDPFVGSEQINYCIAEKIMQHRGIPVSATLDCILVKIWWLLGQGADYNDFGVEMQKNIKGELGRYIVI